MSISTKLSDFKRRSQRQLSKQDESYLELAFSLAVESRKQGAHPFGAVLVCENKVFLKGENQVNRDDNPMKHAEIVLLDKYIEYKNADFEKRLAMSPEFSGQLPDIQECQMFTSTQPCTMCEGAIYTMKVGKNLEDKKQVIFGLDKKNLSILVRNISNHDREVTLAGPFLLDKAKIPHADFWNKA